MRFIHVVPNIKISEYAKHQLRRCPTYHTKRAVLIRSLRRRPYRMKPTAVGFISLTTVLFYLYYNYEKYPLSPLNSRSLTLIEQYLPNISDPVYSVHQSFMWFLWLNWRKSTFYPVTAPNGSKCWPIVTSSIQEPVASNCDVTMTDCSRLVAMDAFLAQWWGQWSQHSGRPRKFLALISLLSYFLLYFVTPVFQHRSQHRWTGPRFHIKTSFYLSKKSHFGDKTVVRSSHLHNRASYTGKTRPRFLAPFAPAGTFLQMELK